MKSFATLFTAAVAVCASVTASPAPAPAGGVLAATHAGVLEIPLTRRGQVAAADAPSAPKTANAVSGGGHKVVPLSAEVQRLRTKYGTGLERYRAKNAGKKHPLDTTAALSRRQLADNQRKRNRKPPNVQPVKAPIKGQAKATSAVVPLTIQQGGVLWTGPISFGTPAKTFTVDFDTGSADLLVNPGVYNPSASKTSSNTRSGFYVQYGDGTTAQGTVYKDRMSVGGLIANNTQIGRATQNFISDSDGIAGMSFPVLSTYQSGQPFFYSLISAGAVTVKSFIFKLRQTGSTLTLGARDAAATYVPVTQPAYWSINAKVNTFSINDAIIDSGTSLIVGRPDQVKALYQSLKVNYAQDQDGTLYAWYTCSKPPSINFKFGTKTIALGSASSYGAIGNGQCYLSIIGSDIGIDAWIVGDPLFQRASITFDIAAKQVGFN